MDNIENNTMNQYTAIRCRAKAGYGKRKLEIISELRMLESNLTHLIIRGAIVETIDNSRELIKSEILQLETELYAIVIDKSKEK